MYVCCKIIKEHQVYSDLIINKAKDGRLLRLFESLVASINNSKIPYSYEQEESYYPDIDFTVSQHLPIEIFFVEDGVNHLFQLDEDCLGLFVTTASIFDEGEATSAQAFRVFVSCNEKYLQRLVMEERELDSHLPAQQVDFSVLLSYLATLTREVQHAIEFRNHCNGLTPNDLDRAIDFNGFDYSMFDVTSGRYILDSMKEITCHQEAIDIMEERVEKEGLRLVSQLLIENSDFKQEFNEYLINLSNNIEQTSDNSTAVKAKKLKM